MRSFILFLVFSVSFIRSAHAQIIHHDSIKAPDDYSNTHVHKVFGDSLSTTFIIYIKEKVPMHKHETHSENVYILEGSAIMYLDGNKYEIKPGDMIFIPQNTWHSVDVTSENPLKVISIQSPLFDGNDRIIFKNQ